MVGRAQQTHNSLHGISRQQANLAHGFRVCTRSAAFGLILSSLAKTHLLRCMHVPPPEHHIDGAGKVHVISAPEGRHIAA